MRNWSAVVSTTLSLVGVALLLTVSTGWSQQIPVQRPLPPFPLTPPPSPPPAPPSEPSRRPSSSEATRPRPADSRPDPAKGDEEKSPRLLISIRTEKAIYKNGERVKLIGKVLNLTGDLPVSSVVDLRVFRKLKPEKKEGAPGPAPEPKEVVYRTLLEPKSTDFSDDGYIIQFPSQETLWVTKQVEFEVGATALPRGGGEGSLAVTAFTAEEIGYVNLFQVLGVFVVGVLYALLLIYLVFMNEPTKPAARKMLLVIYGSGLFFLLVALGGPLLISLSPTTEVILRTTPVGIAKATTEKIKDLQWMANIGGVVGPDNSLKGGYGVPVFILILGVVGGVISMLLKLPDFLRDYDAIEARTAGEAEQVSGLRTRVFKYFVYIVTGPFLGMIVYSLVTLADYTNPLALSVMAFSVGFMSDQIVEAMLAVAGNVLTRTKGLFKKE